MTAIENLNEDHHDILLVMDALDGALVHAARGAVSVPFFELLHHFIVVYADGAHYDKEEQLFNALAQRGMPEQMGPIAFLSLEHDATRAQAHRLGQGLERVKRGDEGGVLDIIEAVARYSAIIRVHLPKETLGFFKMADVMLPAETQQELGRVFHEIENALPSTLREVAHHVVEAAAALGDPAPVAAVVPAAAPLAQPLRSASPIGEQERLDQLVRSLGAELSTASHARAGRRAAGKLH